MLQICERFLKRWRIFKIVVHGLQKVQGGLVTLVGVCDISCAPFGIAGGTRDVTECYRRFQFGQDKVRLSLLYLVKYSFDLPLVVVHELLSLPEPGIMHP